jgi:putative ABC transport system permease protein
MGQLLVIWRLATSDIKRRRSQSTLLVILIAATTTALAVGLTLHNVSKNPFAQTRAETKGPDVVGQVGYAPGTGRPSPSSFTPLLHGAGVAATAGPFPIANVRLTASKTDIGVEAEGRDATLAAVDQPLVLAGGWIRRREAVIERGLADSLGLHVGQTIRLNGHPFRIAGIAITAARPFYPAAEPGLVWLTRTDAEGLATQSQPLGYLLDIKLTDPAKAPTFPFSPAGNAFQQATVARNEPSTLEPWQRVQNSDYRVISLDRKVLLIGSSLLSILAIASIAVLVGGRMAEQTKRVGLLKALGANPAMVAAALLAENLLLALTGAIVGLIAGDLLAPSLASPGAGLLSATEAPQVNASSVMIVIGLALIVAAAATLAPAIHGARTSTLTALNDPGHPPTRHRALIAASRKLPVPMLLGLRLVARRPRRAMLTATSLMIAVAMVVAALTVQHDLNVTGKTPTVGFFVASASGVLANHVLVLLSVTLVILAAVSATFAAWATVIDARTSTALVRSLGATPQQIVGGLAAAQLLPALIAAVIGIPAGLLLYELAGGHLSEAKPPLPMLLAIIPGTLIAVAALTAIPARIGAHRPVADVLRAD